MTDQLDPPKDGTMVCLLVDYSGDGVAPLEDALTAWTIGYNTLADTGEDEWIMVGWDWCHDCYCQGSGKIIGWAPFAPTELERMRAEAERLRTALSHVAGVISGLGLQPLARHPHADDMARYARAALALKKE